MIPAGVNIGYLVLTLIPAGIQCRLGGWDHIGYLLVTGIT